MWVGVLIFLFLWFHSWASKMEALTSQSAADPEGYLAHPVNAYKLVKRLNTDWPVLEDLVLQDSAAGGGQWAGARTWGVWGLSLCWVGTLRDMCAVWMWSLPVPWLSLLYGDLAVGCPWFHYIFIVSSCLFPVFAPLFRWWLFSSYALEIHFYREVGKYWSSHVRKLQILLHLPSDHCCYNSSLFTLAIYIWKNGPCLCTRGCKLTCCEGPCEWTKVSWVAWGVGQCKLGSMGLIWIHYHSYLFEIKCIY